MSAAAVVSNIFRRFGRHHCCRGRDGRIQHDRDSGDSEDFAIASGCDCPPPVFQWVVAVATTSGAEENPQRQKQTEEEDTAGLRKVLPGDYDSCYRPFYHDDDNIGRGNPHHQTRGSDLAIVFLMDYDCDCDCDCGCDLNYGGGENVTVAVAAVVVRTTKGQDAMAAIARPIVTNDAADTPVCCR